jgi:hypothetical protein
MKSVSLLVSINNCSSLPRVQRELLYVTARVNIRTLNVEMKQMGLHPSLEEQKKMPSD